MPVSRSLAAAVVCAAASLAGGCQTFIGLDDAQGHLPRLDGEYLFAISRARKVGGGMDTLRFKGSATLHGDARSLDLSLSILDAQTGARLSESSITDIRFPIDSDEADFMLSIQVPDQAVTTAQDPQDQTLAAPMTLLAQDDYSFCATPQSGDLPTLGTILLETDTSPLPTTPDVDCDTN